MAAAGREIPLKKGESALLVIDMQKGFAVPGKGICSDIDPENIPEKDQYLFNRISQLVVPNVAELIRHCEQNKCEVIYTYVENLTQDGRDRSLDYKITGFSFPKGSEDAELLDEIKPIRPEDTIMIPKTACSVFNSTNIEYVLRNLGVTQLAVCGLVTNQCVESAVRDGADKGFLISVLEDCIATHDQPAHDAALKNMKGFGRIVSYKTIMEELTKWQ
ncbi:unnamed protein product [Owenia fusiformis]|uniref:Uncharacterized protein n=1 Tax=Owenia fusiformis TaxID=6347 RepID=A0A8J1UCL0_OWEFU|nr:unnamed protein product [Owenia fusiformis]